MKVLLLGAKGMLGQALQKEFTGDELTAWDKEELDITAETQVREKITAFREAQGGLDVIINAAAYTAVDAAEENRELAFAVNETGVRNIASVAKEIDATLINYSTDYVFPGDKIDGYAEDDTPGPAVNVYGESKLAGEQALIGCGVRFYLVRTAWLYGPGGKNFVDTMLKLAESRDELRVVNDQYGSPTFTKDVAVATHRLLATSQAHGVYHAVNSGVATWYEFAKEIMKLAGKAVTVTPVASAEYPLPAQRPQYSVLRDTKGLAIRPWQEALKEYIKEKTI